MAWRDLYPFQSNFIRIGGHRLHYVDVGQGQPLLFVHGNPTWSFYWRNLIRGLRHDHRCLAIDHIGCGLSDKPQDYDYTLSRRIDDLVEFVTQLDLTDVTLLAHDWGGSIGLGAVTRLPERFSRLVLFNTGAFPPPFVPWRIAACRLPLVGTLAVRGLNAFAQAATVMAVEKPERMSPDVRDGLVAPYDSWATRIAVDRFVRDIPFTPLHPTWQVLEDLEAQLPALGTRPAMLVWGMGDWCFRPSCLERFLHHWPNAEVHRFDDCGHYVVEDAYERIVPLVREFIARHSIPKTEAIEQ